MPPRRLSEMPAVRSAQRWWEESLYGYEARNRQAQESTSTNDSDDEENEDLVDEAETEAEEGVEEEEEEDGEDDQADEEVSTTCSRYKVLPILY